MERHVATHFRDELRDARAIALRDAEAFNAIWLVVERLAKYRLQRRGWFKEYKEMLKPLADTSPLAEDLPKRWPAYHTSFIDLLDLVYEGRNMAVHEGALARHLTAHAIELALILEDALVKDAPTVADYMVRGPATVAPWQPLSFVRQRMLVNSFTYLPVYMAFEGRQQWWLVSDSSVASYLRTEDREKRLHKPLEEAVADGSVPLIEPKGVGPETPISEVLEPLPSAPVLVVSDQTGELVGILTPFDLL